MPHISSASKLAEAILRAGRLAERRVGLEAPAEDDAGTIVSHEGVTVTVGEDKIYHPIQQDWVTFLRTGKETDGAYLLIEIELGPHGGNLLHRHRAFTETFEPIEGELHVQRDGQELVLHPGETASVPPGTAHRFYSQSDRPIRFRVEIRPPGQFEQVLRVGYGLARDRKVTKQGIPRNPLQAALLFVMGDTYVAAAPVWLQRAIAVPLAALAWRLGVERSFEPYTRVEPLRTSPS